MLAKLTGKNLSELFSDTTPPFIIAEMSGNHEGSLEHALDIVRAAAEAKVDALKLQTFTADSMTLNSDKEEFMANPDSAWKGERLYSLYQQAATPEEWHRPIFELCQELGLYAFSSPFDGKAVDLLESLNVPFYKIASFEIVDIPLIERVAATGKPMIISTGMATEQEITDAVQTAKENGCPEIVLLKCTSAYPAPAKDINLSTIPYLKQKFKSIVGLSDHTLGIGVAVASVAYGASVIEKHFTIDRNQGGVDSSFSMEPAEMTLLVQEAFRAWEARGKPSIGPVGAEHNARLKRRSLYVVNDIKAGEIITKDNVRSIRPGHGLAPKHLKQLLGKMVSYDIAKGTPVSWDFFE